MRCGVPASASFLAELSVSSPRIYLFSLSKKIFSGSKYPKTILFNFEKRSTGTGPFSRASVRRVPRCTGIQVRAMSDTDTISYLTRTTVPVISDESLRTQISELTKPPHHPKWSFAGACSALCRTGTRCVMRKAGI